VKEYFMKIINVVYMTLKDFFNILITHKSYLIFLIIIVFILWKVLDDMQ
jgi:hypothetical protein